MGIKTGIDIVSIRRFQDKYQRLGPKFLASFLSEAEIDLAKGRIASLAGFFAAKEAASKALGSGIWQDGVGWHDLTLTRDSLGKPGLSFSGRAAHLYNEMQGVSHDISISHEDEFALAICQILIREDEKNK